MKPKRLTALLLIAFTLLSLQSAALANAAETEERKSLKKQQIPILRKYK